MMAKKKVNPRKKPVSEADIERAKKIAMNNALTLVEAIVFTVLVDKYGFEDQVFNVWKDSQKLSEEIIEGRVSVNDLVTVLKEEYDVELTTTYIGEK